MNRAGSGAALILLISFFLVGCRSDSTPQGVLALALDAVEKSDQSRLRKLLSESAWEKWNENSKLNQLRARVAGRQFYIEQLERTPRTSQLRILSSYAGTKTEKQSFATAEVRCRRAISPGARPPQRNKKKCKVHSFDIESNRVDRANFESLLNKTQAEVVFLTSVDLTRIPFHYLNPKYRSLFDSFTERLENRASELGLRVVSRHGADQSDLFYALQNPEVKAVFWVSHGFFEEQSNRSAILDQYSFEITPMFSAKRVDLPFLSVMGCYSKKILADLSANETKLMLFDDKVTLEDAFQTSLDALGKLKLNQRQTSSDGSERVPVQVFRTTPGDSFTPSVRIVEKGEIVGVLPTRFSHGKDRVQVSIRPSAKRIEVDSGNSNYFPLTEIDLGKFTLTGESGRWVPFSRADGRPFGVTSRSFIYKK